jgi:hypothetical protein
LISAVVSPASASTGPASTSAKRWFLIISPKLVDTGDAGWNDLCFLGQKLIFIEVIVRLDSEFGAATEKEQRSIIIPAPYPLNPYRQDARSRWSGRRDMLKSIDEPTKDAVVWTCDT